MLLSLAISTQMLLALALKALDEGEISVVSDCTGGLRRFLRYLKNFFKESSLINLSFYQGEKRSTPQRSERSRISSVPWEPRNVILGLHHGLPHSPGTHRHQTLTPITRGRCEGRATCLQEMLLVTEKNPATGEPSFPYSTNNWNENYVVETSLIH